jgi:predicted DNA-binding transcriptional regulator YafY
MARNQEVTRQWSILRTLDANRTGVHIKDLAKELGVVDRTIRRDIAALIEAGFPLYDETRDQRTYWKIREKTFQRLSEVGLSLPEMSALYFGRSVLQCLVGPPFREDITSALGKIANALPRQLRAELDRVNAAFTVKGDPNRLPGTREYRQRVTHLVNTILEHRRVELRYFSMNSRREKTYLVEPYRLVLGDGALYLRAFVPEYKDVRTFAVSRMRAVSPREETFTPRPEESDDPFRNSIGIHTGPPIAVELEFHPRVARYVQERTWHASQRASTLPDGTLRVKLDVSDDLALRSWILGFGRSVRVVSPASLAEWMVEELDQMRTTYAPTGRADGQEPLPFEAALGL